MAKFPIHSMPKVYNLGHRLLADLWQGSVVVQEKVDGSQLSWMWDNYGQLYVRSKSKPQYGAEYDVMDKMFAPAIEHLRQQEPVLHGMFRGEMLAKRKQNTIFYDRVPQGHIVLFDVEFPTGFADFMDLKFYAKDVNVEPVRQLDIWHDGHQASLEELEAFLQVESMLGGSTVEGVVFKNYSRIDPMSTRYPLMGKFVSEKFKEKNKAVWKEKNPGGKDVVGNLAACLNTEARWEKAVQHLSEQGVLLGEPKDIGLLMAEVKRDVLEEEGGWIVEQLVKRLQPQIMRQLGRGLPGWYKRRLAGA